MRQRYADTVRIMLTGEADLQAVIQAINDGAIYKFLTKPWCNDNLRSTLKEACAQSTRVRAPAIEISPHARFCNQLSQLQGSVQVMMLELRNPSILRLLSSTQVQLFLTELELIVGRSCRLLGRITQLEDTLFAFALEAAPDDQGRSVLQDLARPIDLGGQIVSPRFALGVANRALEGDALAAQDALRGSHRCRDGDGFRR